MLYHNQITSYEYRNMKQNMMFCNKNKRSYYNDYSIGTRLQHLDCPYNGIPMKKLKKKSSKGLKSGQVFQYKRGHKIAICKKY